MFKVNDVSIEFSLSRLSRLLLQAVFTCDNNFRIPSTKSVYSKSLPQLRCNRLLHRSDAPSFSEKADTVSGNAFHRSGKAHMLFGSRFDIDLL